MVMSLKSNTMIIKLSVPVKPVRIYYKFCIFVPCMYRRWYRRCIYCSVCRLVQFLTIRDVVGQERARVARYRRRAAAWWRPGATARGDFARITFLHISTIKSTTFTSLRLPIITECHSRTHQIHLTSSSDLFSLTYQMACRSLNLVLYKKPGSCRR